MLLSEKLQKLCGQKQKNIWSKLKKEYCKENCIDGSVIEPIIIDFCDDDWDNNNNNNNNKFFIYRGLHS